MKKILMICALCCAAVSVKAEELNFSYNAGFDITSCYIWRGIYNGGLSFQPDLGVGWESEHTSFSIGTWWNVGATDWKFTSGLPSTEDYNPNTYFVPEVDVYASLNLWGAVVGFNHFYFFDGTDYFNVGKISEISGTAMTEVTVGYDFSTLFPKVDFQLTWNTIVNGNDGDYTTGKRYYSTEIEASYTHHFVHDMSLQAVFGVSPWKGLYTDYEYDWAVNNLSLRFDKEWSFAKDAVCLDLYLLGTVNTCNLNKDTAFVNASGDDKLGCQKLMGAIGVNISF